MNWLKARPVAVITFDDGHNDHATKAFKVLKRNDAKGTCYIIGSRDFYPNLTMSWEDMKRLRKNSWNIECHTFNHPPLEELTKEEIINEMILLNEAFEENGLEKPTHHAYPRGSYNQLVKDTLKDYRITQRHTGHLATHFNTLSSIVMESIQGINADIDDDDKMQLIKETIDNTKHKNGIFVPYSHGLNTKRLSYFTEMVEYAKAQGLTFTTIEGLYDYYERSKRGFYTFVN